MGNIILSGFDDEMNKGDCVCIRYIDDFLIIAPTVKAAKARMKRAINLLKKLGMELSEEKSSRVPISISSSFEFLGIELNNGFIRPSNKSQQKVVAKIEAEFKNSIDSMNDLLISEKFDKQYSLVSTLRRVDGIG